MTTTPEPAVSPAPDTDALALRVEIAKQLARHDAELWGYDHGFTTYGSDEESDSFVTLMAKLIEQREAGLRADLDRARAAAGDWEGAARAEADSARIQIAALSELLRGMARKVSAWRRYADTLAQGHKEQAAAAGRVLDERQDEITELRATVLRLREGHGQ